MGLTVACLDLPVTSVSAAGVQAASGSSGHGPADRSGNTDAAAVDTAVRPSLPGTPAGAWSRGHGQAGLLQASEHRAAGPARRRGYLHRYPLLPACLPACSLGPRRRFSTWWRGTGPLDSGSVCVGASQRTHWPAWRLGESQRHRITGSNVVCNADNDLPCDERGTIAWFTHSCRAVRPRRSRRSSS